jgi:hypothetical protein
MISEEENKTIIVKLEELPKEELICQIEDADFKIRGLERQIRDLKKKIQQLTQVFENEETTYHEVVENLTRKCTIYERLILEQHPETELNELREAVQEEIEKTKAEIKMTPQEYEIQRNHNLEEISILTSTPTKSSSMIQVPGLFQLDFDVRSFFFFKILKKEDYSPKSPKVSGQKSSLNNLFAPKSTKGPASPRLEKRSTVSTSKQEIKKKEKVTAQAVEAHDSDDEETEFSENDMLQMMQSETEKKNKDVAFSEKILNSLTIGVKVSVSFFRVN